MAQMPILIILAGGASSRMWPLREKSLLRFGTESLLIGQLQRYRALGFQEAVIVVNPENQADITRLTGQMSSMNIRLVVQPEPKGMGDALLRAETALADRSNTAIYINQVHDVVDDKLHLDLLANYNLDPLSSYLAGYQMEAYFPGGYLIVDANGRISGMVEKPAPEDAPSNLAIIGRYVLTPKIFDKLEQTQRGAGGEIQLTDAIAALMEEQSVYGYEFEGIRYDAGTTMGWLKASVELALARPDLGPEFRTYLAGLTL